MSEIIICKNCGNQFSGKYCNACGEKVYGIKDRSLHHLAEEFFHFLFHFEGTLITTLKTFIKKPGLVSEDYCNGIRKKYFKPLSLFLLLVVIYLIFPLFEGLNMKMQFYLTSGFSHFYAAKKIPQTMLETGLSEKELAEAFHHKAEKISKFLLILIVPLSALWCWLCTFKKRKYFFDQIVFAAELNCVFLLWGFLFFPLILFLSQYIFHKVSGNYFEMSDGISGLGINLILAIYTAFAARRFYQIKKWQSIIFAFLFVAVHSFIIIPLYKLILFVITINQIH